eukprot:TRINITY_DN2014_c0_g1_i6.p1 TRINITY_DN2014_c0_g1~~TRINITY_DN2014_c0_g1_i6.p1  ORF type:complete len:1252 (-),score=251.60 TRINITY_DN2014_c0_g1_i6:275-4030(-)
MKYALTFMSTGREEHQSLIQLLVRRILDELSNTPMGVASYTVGLNSRVEDLMRLLDVKSNGIQVSGFHGMGGVGKTTLAKALYNKLVSQFEHRSFISNVREASMQPNGLVSLQRKLLGDLSLGKASGVNDVSAGKIAIKGILNDKRVLVVLDDVDDVSQLGALAIKREWFYEGSRIIITTRDRNVLLAYHVDKIYEVKELGFSDSLKLFRYHALGSKNSSGAFLQQSHQIVSLTGRLPLALEVFGSFLFDKRRVEEWEDTLHKLKQIRPRHLHDILKISFDGLDDEEKCIFLDIACLFINLGMKRDNAVDILKGCGFRAEIAINVLVARSLIKIMEDNTLWMHDQMRDMGRQIVHLENLVDPGMRSRLWNPSEILTVLKDRMGTRHVQGIILDFENFPKETFHYDSKKDGEMILHTEAFQSMVCLRLLQLSNVQLEGNFKCLPPELKWLRWRRCPLKNLPPSFCPPQLTVLDLSESKIESLWGWKLWGWYNNEVAANLMVMNLRGCCNLAAIPDLSRHQALEKLILERCTSLTTIHKSLGDMTMLRHLNMRDCSNLVELPNVSGLKHLEILILSGCSRLKAIPQDIRGMNSLRELLLDKTAIDKLPESIFWLTKLERLSLNDCQSLKQLPLHITQLVSLRDLSLDGSALEEIPNSIGSLQNLEKLSLMRCKSLTVLPDSLGDLKLLSELWLKESSVKELPTSIGSLFCLKHLSVGSKLPVSIGGLASVVELQLDGTLIVDLPDQVDGLKSLQKLEMRNCVSLRSLPESIGRVLTLTTLIMVNAAITELPDSIGMLENLIMLNLNECMQLCSLPSSIGKLKSLHHLRMEQTAVTELPESFGMLSSLMVLKMAKKPYFHEVSENSKNDELKLLSAEEKWLPVALPSSFSNLSSLEELNARAWKISGKIPDDFEKLSALENLNLCHNDFYSLPCSLRGLSILKKLHLSHCKYLRVLPPLPSSLVELNAANCTALESIYDLSNLENLRDLNLANCEKLKGIPGLERLKSLRMLYMTGCRSCCSEAKPKLDKNILRNLYYLSVPGSEIPDWFTPDVVSYIKPKNRVLKAVIIGVVVSIDHQIANDLRDELPVVVGVEVKILRLNKPVFNTGPHLAGVPKTDEDHFYLCRYQDQPLVYYLKDGDRIQVTMRDPPIVKGVQLKKCGIHLVFENDDDYAGDEESLSESHQSVSRKLETFIGSSDDNDRVLDSISEVEREGQGRRREPRSLDRASSFVLPFIVLPSSFLLLSWLVSKFYM